MISWLLYVLMVLHNPCATEDSTNCIWDAAIRGNGYGSSYAVFEL
jgi:hypothetical protein